MYSLTLEAEGVSFKVLLTPREKMFILQLADTRSVDAPIIELEISKMTRQVVVEAIIRLYNTARVPAWAQALKGSILGFFTAMPDSFFDAYLAGGPKRRIRPWSS